MRDGHVVMEEDDVIIRSGSDIMIKQEAHLISDGFSIQSALRPPQVRTSENTSTANQGRTAQIHEVSLCSLLFDLLR